MLRKISISLGSVWNTLPYFGQYINLYIYIICVLFGLQQSEDNWTWNTNSPHCVIVELSLDASGSAESATAGSLARHGGLQRGTGHPAQDFPHPAHLSFSFHVWELSSYIVQCMLKKVHARCIEKSLHHRSSPVRLPSLCREKELRSCLCLTAGCHLDRWSINRLVQDIELLLWRDRFTCRLQTCFDLLYFGWEVGNWHEAINKRMLETFIKLSPSNIWFSVTCLSFEMISHTTLPGYEIEGESL